MSTSQVIGMLLGAALLGTAARADMIQIQSAEGLEGQASFTGSIEYAASGLVGTLTFSITNTSDPGNGGFITGFAFDVASADTAALITLASGTHPFEDISDVSAPPFGVFEHGAALGGSWVGGGNPTVGIGVGETGTFTFHVDASDAASLTAADFISPETGEPGGDEIGMALRFRGFNNGRSDKVPGREVPAPGSMVLMGIAGMVALRRGR